MRVTAIGVSLLLAGLTAVLTGVLPSGDVRVLFDRVWPILLFVAVVVPLSVLFLIYRKPLLGTYTPEAVTALQDRTIFAWSAIVIALLVPALISGLAVWIPATVAALVLSWARSSHR